MPIIPAIGRRHWKIRAAIIFVYAVLALGSMTTVYPFLMMLSTASTTRTDWELYHVPPRYTYDWRFLMAEYLDDKYKREIFDIMRMRYHLEEPFEVALADQTIKRWYGRTIEMVPKDIFRQYDLSDAKLRSRLADWNEFVRQLPMKYKDTYFHGGTFPVATSDVAFQSFLHKKFPTIGELQKGIEQQVRTLVAVTLPYDAYERHEWYPAENAVSQLWLECRKTLPDHAMNAVTVRPIYGKYLLESYSKKIEALNAEWGTAYEYFWQVPFPPARPAGPEGNRWEVFLRKRMPMRYVRLDASVCRPSYNAFLKDTYETIDEYNAKMGDNAASFDEVVLPEYMPESSKPLWQWQTYYENRAPLEGIVLDTADVRYAAFLTSRYGNVGALNDAYRTAFASLDDAEPPWREADYADLMERRGRIVRDFLTRNYVYVLKRVFLQGRAIINTFILVTLVVLTQITINPLAAYALSRYRLSYTSKVLIFMLATMAFPAEVSMIPNFLMIRDLGLLNTFAALVLPGLASGYFVFLLKGFFDSLPQELYESASIDGASEVRMFWSITLPLSLPVLSVIALFSFGGAYGSFLWSFTTCQDSKMWTLMVFLHQFSVEAGGANPYVVMASLVIAAIPTVIVFLSAQKVLLKGIVVPTMK